MTTITLPLLSSNSIKTDETKIEPTAQPLKKEIVHLFDSLSSAWEYTDRSMSLTRHILNIIVRTSNFVAFGCYEINRAARKGIVHLRLFTIINAPKEIISLPGKVKQIWQNVKWKNVEGILLSTLTFTVTVSDIFDTVTTFVNAVLQVVSKPVVGWISVIAAPFGLALLSLSSISRGVHLYQFSKFRGEIDGDLLKKIEEKQLSSQELRDLLTPFLEKHLGTEQMDATEKNMKENILQRHTNKQTVAQMQELAKRIQSGQSLSDQDMQDVVRSIKSMREAISDEMTFHTVHLLSNAVAGIAMVLLFTPAAPIAPFILLAACYSLRIGNSAYRDWKKKHKTQLSIPKTEKAASASA